MTMTIENMNATSIAIEGTTTFVDNIMTNVNSGRFLTDTPVTHAIWAAVKGGNFWSEFDIDTLAKFRVSVNNDDDLVTLVDLINRAWLNTAFDFHKALCHYMIDELKNSGQIDCKTQAHYKTVYDMNVASIDKAESFTVSFLKEFHSFFKNKFTEDKCADIIWSTRYKEYVSEAIFDYNKIVEENLHKKTANRLSDIFSTIGLK